MKVSVLQADIAPIIAIATHFVSNKAQLPILANVKLTGTKAKLLIQATNLEMSLSSEIGAKVDEAGEITIPARTFSEFIATLPQGKLVIEASEERAHIQCEGVTAHISGMNSSDFPEIESRLTDHPVSFPVDTFASALKKVLFSVSLDDTRPQLTGVLLEVTKSFVRMVATDGFRLSKIDIPTDSKEVYPPVIIPKAIFNEIIKLSGKEDSLIYSYNESQSLVSFQLGQTIISSKVIAGVFPPYEKHIPDSYKTKVNVSKKELLGALKTASVFARENANLVTLGFSDKTLAVSASSSQSGEQKTEIAAQIEGESVTIVYNYRYIEEVLASIEGESVVFEFQDGLSTGVVKDPQNEKFLHLVMPVKA